MNKHKAFSDMMRGIYVYRANGELMRIVDVVVGWILIFLTCSNTEAALPTFYLQVMPVVA